MLGLYLLFIWVRYLERSYILMPLVMINETNIGWIWEKSPIWVIQEGREHSFVWNAKDCRRVAI
jgi:hypothetical protein